jgi:hypothetical protein
MQSKCFGHESGEGIMLLRNLVLSAFSIIKSHYSNGADNNAPSGSPAYPANTQYAPPPRPHAASFSSHGQANKFMASQNAIYGRPVGGQRPGHGYTPAGPPTVDSRFSTTSTYTNGATSFSTSQVSPGHSTAGGRYPGTSPPDIAEFGLPAGQRRRHSAGNLGSYVVMDDGSHQFLKGGGYIPGSS